MVRTSYALEVRDINIYIEPLIVVQISYALAAMSKCFAFVKCVCILSFHEIGYQTVDQSGLMICAQLCNMYDNNLRSQ
jgi:hypothetical protein